MVAIDQERADAGILDGIRIVDLSDGIAGPVATLLLAEAGADVIAVEPPAGAANRSTAGFHTWMRSKRSVVLDLDQPADRASLDDLLAAADVVVHNHGPTRARELGLDDATLAERHPQLIASSMLSWPANHAEADMPVDELLALARLGLLDEQQGYRDGPIFLRCPIGSWCASHLGAIGIMARLIARERTGRAGPAHTSIAQGALVPTAMHWRRVELPSPSLAIGMPKAQTGASLFESGDGVWLHLMGEPTKSPLFREAMAQVRPEGQRDDPTVLFGMFDGWADALMLHPSHEWLETFWANDVPVQPALAPGEIFTNDQALANNYVVEVDHPELGHIAMAGSPITVEPPTRVRNFAPALGQHTREVLDEWKPREREHSVATTDAEQRWPLEGVKVVDAGGFLAGPLGPMMLADLGADVVKVEATTGEGMRNVEWAFFGCQRGKRDVALDLKSPAARPAVEALLAQADIFHHNVRMPAAHRLGLDEESVRAVNPDIIYCHTSSYGPEGPRADWPGYDQLFQASCGWEVAGAGEGNPPMWHRFGFMDHLCAMGSVIATLLALYHRDRTGQTQFAAGSLLGGGVLTGSETYLDPSGKTAAVPMLDHEQTGVSPGYRILPVTDGWIAIAATTDDQLHALCTAAGVSVVDAAADALATRTSDDALTALTAAGVPCEAVRLDQCESFFASADNDAAGMIARYRHVDYGDVEQPGAFWAFGDLDVKLDRAPPGLGEHTVEVLTEVGLDRDTIDAMLAEGAAHEWKAGTGA
jgi:crotonobetainyl-CoA:carnitine CoA-transferase CaiB-like acyl-CoA transferase